MRFLARALTRTVAHPPLSLSLSLYLSIYLPLCSLTLSSNVTFGTFGAALLGDATLGLIAGEFILCTVTFRANRAHYLTRFP